MPALVARALQLGNFITVESSGESITVITPWPQCMIDLIIRRAIASVTKVVCRQGNQVIAASSCGPDFVLSWSNPVGEYTLQAFDSHGRSVGSAIELKAVVGSAPVTQKQQLVVAASCRRALLPLNGTDRKGRPWLSQYDGWR